MKNLKMLLTKPRNRVIAAVLSATLIISAVAAGLSWTLAANDDVAGEFICGNSYARLGLGTELVSYNSGVFRAATSDASIASVSVESGKSTVTANKAAPKSGTAVISYVPASGLVRNINYQVYDPNGLSGYTIPHGRLSFAKNKMTPAELKLTLKTDSQSFDYKAWNAANPDNKITWELIHGDVVEFDPDAGLVTPVNEGSAIIIGTVADKWGVTQQIPYLVQVGAGDASATLSSMSVLIPPKTEYMLNEYFAENNMTLLLLYDNGALNLVSSGFAVWREGAEGGGFGGQLVSGQTKFTAVESFTAIVEYQGFTDEVAITVVNPHIIVDGPARTVEGDILPGRLVGDPSSDWLEVAQNGGYSLIVRMKVTECTPFRAGVNDSNYAASTLRNKMNEFYATGLTNDTLKNYAAKSNALSRIEAIGAMVAADNKGFSVPSDDPITESDTDIMFAMSASESAQYCSLQHYKNTNVNGNVASNSTAQSNFYEMVKIGNGNNVAGKRYESWFRTPFSGTQAIHLMVSGGFHRDNANYKDNFLDQKGGLGIRPCMWVKSDIFVDLGIRANALK